MDCFTTAASPRRRRAPSVRAVLLALPLALAAGCSGGADADADQGGVTTTVDSAGGIPRVTNAGTPPTWRLDSLLVVERAGDEEFGRITGVVGDWAGNVYVADAQARRLYRIGNDGALMATIGREGGGPDELRDVKSLAWVGGKLAVLDAGNGRIPLLSPDGTPSGEAVPWMALSGDVALQQTAPGEAYAMVVLHREEGGGSGRAYLRLIGAGTPDTFPAPALPEVERTSIVCEGREMLTFFSVPQAPRAYSAFAPGQLAVVGQTGEYRLAFLNAAGDTVRVVARDLAPAPVTDADWADTEQRWAEFQERTRGMRCDGTSISRPAAKPAFAGLFFDDRGRMWVEAADTVGYRFDVFDSTGALRGSMPAPPRDRRVSPHVRTGRLFYVELDSLDVQRVRVAQIVEEGPPPEA